MIFQRDWLDEEKTIILTTIPEKFSWEEYHKNTAQVAEMVLGVEHIVDIILDATNAPLPKGNPFPHFKRFVRGLPGNTGVVVNFGAPKIDRVLASAFLSVYSRRSPHFSMHVVNTLVDAQAIIVRRREQEAFS
jgi:hypothetical protein